MKRKREGTDDTAGINRVRAKSRQEQTTDGAANPSTVVPARGANAAISGMDSGLLADYVAQRNRRFGEHLSPVEVEDMRIPENAILDTSGWAHDRSLQDLPSFLEYFSRGSGTQGDLSSAPDTPGAPHTLVLTAAARRAVDLVRALKPLQPNDAIIAKLFAKHIKLKDAIDHVKKTRMNIGVGTPSRIVDLITEGALACESLQRVVIDCSFLDQKQRSIFDLRETQQPLMQLLNRKELKDRYSGSHVPVKLIFY